MSPSMSHFSADNAVLLNKICRQFDIVFGSYGLSYDGLVE